MLNQSFILNVLIILIEKGVFYDETYDDVEDLVDYAFEINNKLFKDRLFQFDYSIIRVRMHENLKLSKKCKFIRRLLNE